jgi:antitoxin component of RelBE/YafQ-DinJ toxin-antitoxin module
MKDTKQLIVQMDETLHRQFKAQCAVVGTTMADKIRELISQFAVEEK